MAQYPTVLAGQRITATLLSSLMPVFVHKAGATDRANTTTPTNDPDLTIELEGNAVYHVEMFIHYGAISAAGFQTSWAVPTGATGVRWCLGAGSTQTTDDNIPMRTGVHQFTTDCGYGDRNGSANQNGCLEQAVVTTTSAGTLALQWSQDTSSATATSVAAGSFMRVTRLA